MVEPRCPDKFVLYDLHDLVDLAKTVKQPCGESLLHIVKRSENIDSIYQRQVRAVIRYRHF